MAHLFTTPFSYLGRTYTAVVTFSDYDNSRTLSIFLPDESLHTILPYGKFSFDIKTGLGSDQSLMIPAQNLLVSVLDAIDVEKRRLKIN